MAIKFYTNRRGLDWPLLTREVEKLAVLYTSRNVVGLLDVGWNHDPPFFVMEYLENGSLAARLERGPLPVADAVRMTKAIGRALVHAHGSGILHCDLKPANVLLDNEGEPRLGDFGQSRLTTEQSPALGTLFYMGPEQADLGGVPDARWDVYALGALLYHMITGAPPHRTPQIEVEIRSAATLEERLENYRREIIASPSPSAHRRVPGVDKELSRVIEGCLKRNAEDRLPNAQVVLDLLERREENQAKRPLIALGFLGPILLLCAMTWIAHSSVPKAVGKAGDHLSDRALAGNTVSALILADSIHRELRTRRERLEELADDEAVRSIVRDASGLSREELIPLIEEADDAESEPAAAYAALNRSKSESDRSLREEGRTVDQSWFVQDAQGRQIYRQPSRDRDDQPQGTIGKPYHWRSYFHGGGEDLDRSTPVGATVLRTRPGVSAPFRSDATGQYMVAIAVPVWDETHHAWIQEGRVGEDPGQVIGVLARTLHLSELLSQWEEMVGEPGGGTNRTDRFLSLVTATDDEADVFKATLLDHPWMTEEHLRAVTSEGRTRRADVAVETRRKNGRTAAAAAGGGDLGVPRTRLSRSDRAGSGRVRPSVAGRLRAGQGYALDRRRAGKGGNGPATGRGRQADLHPRRFRGDRRLRPAPRPAVVSHQPRFGVAAPGAFVRRIQGERSAGRWLAGAAWFNRSIED